MPERKVWSAGIGGAIATVIIWALNTYVLSVPIEGEIAAAMTAIVTAAVAYLVPNPDGESSSP